MAEKGQYDDAIDILWHMGDYEDSWERVGYYRLREQEDALATSTDHDALLTLATDYSSWGEYLDCAKRAEALTKMANSVMEEKYKVAIDLMNAGNDTEAFKHSWHSNRPPSLHSRKSPFLRLLSSLMKSISLAS